MLNRFIAGEHERHAIGPDMVKEIDKMYRIDEDNFPEWKAKFDPTTF